MSFFPFNYGVPAAANNPSNDQSPMEQNNVSTFGLIGVDHVTFNENTGGYHTAITFDQTGGGSAYVPTPPVSPPKLFTNILDGVGNLLPEGFPQLFYYSGDSANTEDQYVSASNGSVLLQGGIILKWGSSGATGTPTSFVTAFPHNCFAVLLTGTSTLYTGGFVATNVSVAGFTAVRTSGTGATGYYYLAIGN